MIWATLTMALALGIVMTFLIFLVRMFKRWEGGRSGAGSDAGIRVLTSKLIAPQKYVSLVEIGGEVLALGGAAIYAKTKPEALAEGFQLAARVSRRAATRGTARQSSSRRRKGSRR